MQYLWSNGLLYVPLSSNVPAYSEGVEPPLNLFLTAVIIFPNQ